MKDSFGESFVSTVCSGNQTQVSRLAFSPLSHLSSPTLKQLISLYALLHCILYMCVVNLEF